MVVSAVSGVTFTSENGPYWSSVVLSGWMGGVPVIGLIVTTTAGPVNEFGGIWTPALPFGVTRFCGVLLGKTTLLTVP